jgi:hypothetical protein
MATWSAEIKVGTYGTPFNVQVVAGSSGTAKETINTIYNPVYIRNLHQISSRNVSSGASSNTTEVTPGMYWFVGGVFVLYFVVTYWYIVVPIGILLALLIWWGKN